MKSLDVHKTYQAQRPLRANELCHDMEAMKKSEDLILAARELFFETRIALQEFLPAELNFRHQKFLMLHFQSETCYISRNACSCIETSGH